MTWNKYIYYIIPTSFIWFKKILKLCQKLCFIYFLKYFYLMWCIGIQICMYIQYTYTMCVFSFYQVCPMFAIFVYLAVSSCVKWWMIYVTSAALSDRKWDLLQYMYNLLPMFVKINFRNNVIILISSNFPSLCMFVCARMSTSWSYQFIM